MRKQLNKLSSFFGFSDKLNPSHLIQKQILQLVITENWFTTFVWLSHGDITNQNCGFSFLAPRV